MRKISRRRFVTSILGGIGLSTLAGCAPLEVPWAGVPSSPPAGTPTTKSTSGVATPGAVRQPPVTLRNEDTPDFYVRYYRSFQALDPDRWTLSVEGLVKRARQMALPEVLALPMVSQVSRMKCVECWSAPARWEGFTLAALAQQVVPESEARWVHFHCADGYHESLKLEELLMPRVLFAHRMNGQPLPDPHGAPLRLIVPSKYGYKGSKAIVRLVFAREELRGYWPTVGTYSTRGDIEAGWDRPLDLPESRRIGGGEIRYPDGIEGGAG